MGTIASLRKKFEQGSQVYKTATLLIRKWKSVLSKSPKANASPSKLRSNQLPTAGPAGPSKSSSSSSSGHRLLANPVQNRGAISSKREKMVKIFERDLLMEKEWAKEYPEYEGTAERIEAAIYKASLTKDLSKRDTYYIRKIREI